MSTRRTLKNMVVGAAVLLAVLGAGVAEATIPDSGGTIHGCYKSVGGDLSVIDPGTGAACKPSETSLVWGQTGPTGAPGPQGAQGAIGAQGAQGPDGVAG